MKPARTRIIPVSMLKRIARSKAHQHRRALARAFARLPVAGFETFNTLNGVDIGAALFRRKMRYPEHRVRLMTAGSAIKAGQMVYLGDDGRVRPVQAVWFDEPRFKPRLVSICAVDANGREECLWPPDSPSSIPDALPGWRAR